MFESKAIAFVLVVLLIVTPCAYGDVIPEGRKYVAVDIVLDLGSWADQAWTAHVVKRGDNFSSIAKKYYGNANRASEIQKANPRVIAKKMKIGTRLEIPPTTTHTMKDGKKVTIEALRFYWWTDPDFRNGPPELVENKAIAKNPRYSGILIAIPHDQKKAFEEAARNRGDRQADPAWQKIPGLVKSKNVGGRRTVSQGSPTKKIVVSVALTTVNKKELTTKRTETELNGDGKVVTWQQSARLPLLAASGIGLLLFGGLYTRRRREQRTPLAD